MISVHDSGWFVPLKGCLLASSFSIRLAELAWVLIELQSVSRSEPVWCQQRHSTARRPEGHGAANHGLLVKSPSPCRIPRAMQGWQGTGISLLGQPRERKLLVAMLRSREDNCGCKKERELKTPRSAGSTRVRTHFKHVISNELFLPSHAHGNVTLSCWTF